jgi:hypothetical protein
MPVSLPSLVTLPYLVKAGSYEFSPFYSYSLLPISVFLNVNFLHKLFKASYFPVYERPSTVQKWTKLIILLFLL